MRFSREASRSFDWAREVCAGRESAYLSERSASRRFQPEGTARLYAGWLVLGVLMLDDAMELVTELERRLDELRGYL